MEEGGGGGGLLHLFHSEHPNMTTIASIDWFSHRSTTQPSIVGSQHAAELMCKPPPIFCVSTHVAARRKQYAAGTGGGGGTEQRRVTSQ